ncbi:helix-turn-helix domain-containing protein [Nesterenkonia sphaerica]|nr:helix-turn-helix transcriptional regulator [Nesterenkonia sphaerica]
MGLFDQDMKDPQYRRTYAQEAAMVDSSELIADALERSGITRTALAKALNVSKSEVSNRLRGERNITVRKLADTLHALGFELILSSRPVEARQDSPAAGAELPTARMQTEEFGRWKFVGFRHDHDHDPSAERVQELGLLHTHGRAVSVDLVKNEMAKS